MPENEVKQDRWLRLAEVEERLGVHRNTLYRWIHERDLPAVKAGATWRVRESELERWLERGR